MYVSRVDHWWILAVGDADSLRDLVTRRYEAGPFAPCAETDSFVFRQVEIGAGWVREIGRTVGEPDFLARHVAEATREPVLLQWPDCEHARELAPGDDPATKPREVGLRPPPDHVATHRLFFTFDLDKQRAIERAFIASVERTVMAQFPIHNQRKTARLDCKKLAAYDSLTGVRYRYLRADLQLALYEWSDDGNERTMTELRKGSAELGRYFMLTPAGTMTSANGHEYVIPYDEYVAQFHASMTRHLRRIHRVMGRTEWAGVTPESLAEREYTTARDRR